MNSTSTKIRVLLVISDLEYGGTQRQVVALANSLNETAGFEAHICTLSDFCPLADRLIDAQRRLHGVKKKHKYDLGAARRIAQLIRRLGVSVVHCFLFDAEILGRIAARLSGVPVVLGSERCSVGRMSWKKRLGLKMTDGLIDGVIANSISGRERYIRDVGTDPSRVFVVFNGVDTQRFRPLGASSLRKELGIPLEAQVVGMFASFKAHKNYEMYVRTARWLLSRHSQIWFLAVGSVLLDGYDGSAVRYQEIKDLVEELGLAKRFLFVGNRSDVEMTYNACDVTVLTSFYEGTPNVLLESMACGIPAVATSVSDNALIVRHGETGLITSSNDFEECGRHVSSILSDDVERRALGSRARVDMQERYSLACLADRTLNVYQQLLRNAHRGGQDDRKGA